MAKRKDRSADLLLKIETSINIYLSTPEIQEMLSVYGYSVRSFEEAKENFSQLSEKIFELSRRKGAELNAAYKMRELKESCNKNYMIHLKIVRIVLKDNPILLDKVFATGRREKKISAWIIQAKTFYNNILESPEVLEGIKQFNLSSELLQETKNKIDELELKYQERMRLKAIAREMTVIKNKKLKEMERWYKDLLVIGKIAFESSPQSLELFGVVVP